MVRAECCSICGYRSKASEEFIWDDGENHSEDDEYFGYGFIPTCIKCIEKREQ